LKIAVVAETMINATSSECRKKKYTYQKKTDIFPLFFGVIGGSKNTAGLILIRTAWGQFIRLGLDHRFGHQAGPLRLCTNGVSQRRKGWPKRWSSPSIDIDMPAVASNNGQTDGL
jgi:hypothetical protein